MPPIGKLNFRPGNENQTLHDTQSADSVEPVLRFGGGGFGAGLGRPEAGLRPDGSGRRVRLFRRLRSASAQPEFAHRAATRFAGRRHLIRTGPGGDHVFALSMDARHLAARRVSGAGRFRLYGLRRVAAGEIQYRRHAAHGVLRTAQPGGGDALRFAGAVVRDQRTGSFRARRFLPLPWSWDC